MMAARRKYFVIIAGVIGLLTLVITIRAINGDKPSADALEIAQNCDESKEDCTIDLIVVNVNQDSTHNLTAYSTTGKTVVAGRATLAANTWEMIGEPSEFALGNLGRQATPLGLYSRGKVWSSSNNDPDGYPYHSKIGNYNTYGSLFIELSGSPVDGGTDLCGLNDGEDCRHIGIHSSSNQRLTCSTLGCVKIEDDMVRRIAKFSGEGTPVLVTDQVLAGNVSPVDPESYDPNFSHPSKISKTDFSAFVSVEGKRVGKIHKYGSFWISETAKPEGKYYIFASAPGYISNSSSVTFSRYEDSSGQPSIKKEGASSVVLGLPSDMMRSNYFSGTLYGNGYYDQLRFSQWDVSYSNVLVPDMETGTLRIPISVGSPACYFSGSESEEFYMAGEPGCNGEIKSRFEVYAVLSPWHDLGYGSYFKSPALSQKIGQFEYSYSKNAPNEINVSLDLSLLNENQLRALKVWGVAITQTEKIGHVLNDFIYAIDVIRNNTFNIGTLNELEFEDLRADNILQYQNKNDASTLQTEAGLYEPKSVTGLQPEEPENLFIELQAPEPAPWDPINIFNTAQEIEYSPMELVDTSDGSFMVTPAVPEVYKNWYDYLNPVNWFAPEPIPFEPNFYSL